MPSSKYLITYVYKLISLTFVKNEYNFKGYIDLVVKTLLLSTVLLLALSLTFTSCRETKNESVEDTLENAADAVEDAADDAADATEGALEEAGKAIDNAVDEVKEAGEATKDAVDEIDGDDN